MTGFKQTKASSTIAADACILEQTHCGRWRAAPIVCLRSPAGQLGERLEKDSDVETNFEMHVLSFERQKTGVMSPKADS